MRKVFKTRAVGIIAALGVAATVGTTVAEPAQATVEYGNPAALIGVHNSPASYTYGMVQFHDTTYGSFFLDTVDVDVQKGEGTSKDVYAESVRFRISPGQCGRYRYLYQPDIYVWTSWQVHPFSGWWKNSSSSDLWVTLNAGGQVPLNQTNMSGRYLFEFELLPGSYC